MRRSADWMLVLGIGISLAIAGTTHARFRGNYQFVAKANVVGYLVYGAALLLTAYAAGLPEIPSGVWSALAATIAASIGAAAIVSTIQALTVPLLLPRFVVLVTPLLVSPWYIICWRLAQLGDKRERARERVLVLASPAEADELERDLAVAPERQATVVAVLDPHVLPAGTEATSAVLNLARTSEATLIVLSEDAQRDETLVLQVAQLHEQGVRVRTLTAFYDGWMGKLPISELGRMSLMFDIGDIHQPVYTRTKRLIDLVVAVVALPVFALLIPLVLLGNAIASRGPLFFHQVRVGIGGKPFTILKFRTMVPTATEDGAGEWTLVDDPRITRFGRLLRRTHLDELPQAWNVVRGDLSIVGPRPEQPQYVSRLAEKLPFYGMRHVVRPGITGWAQVKWWYADNEIDTYQKLQYELYYLRHQSLTLDARICARTVRHILHGLGR